MYRVTCDNVTLYDTRDEDLVLIDPKVTLELNSPGSFTCKIPPTHPHYDAPVKMLSRITVYQDDEILFKGRITKMNLDYYNRKELYCEGELAFLNDTVQRPAEYHDLTPREYFAKIVEIHNSQVEADKQFEVGMVTVTNSTDNVYRYTNWESSLKAIKEDLIDDMGGYIRVRNADGHRYLDYIKDYGVINQQVIEFGENLLDFTRNIDMTDIATVVVPLGNRLEESSIPALEERLTISSVNGGKDYLVNQDAIKKYGWIVKVVTWDDVTTPQWLKSHGEKWLTDEQFENMTIEAKAVDLHYVDDTKQAIRVGDSVRIVSRPHGLDKYFPVTKMTISLNQLSQNTLTFNGTVKASVSTKTNAISQSLKTQIEELPTKNAVVADAIKQATALITAATHGYVTIADDASELFICNDPDYTKATKLWRWNLNGLGYSDNGYKGDYETAITMDGQILGDRLVGNSVDASKLTIDYKTSVTEEIASKAQEAQQNSEEYADNQLKNYYTKTETETSISNTKDAVLISAKETSTQYTDDQLASQKQELQSAIDNATTVANSATDLAKAAQSTANKKIVTYYQASAPSSGMTSGDLWIDTDEGNKLYRYDGSAWTAIQDKAISDAMTAAGTAQATADGKVVTYAQTDAPPSTGLTVGDLWIDTDDNNHMYRWSGSAWFEVRDGYIDEAKSAAISSANNHTDTKLKNYYTKAEVKITTDGISQTVQKKVGYNDVISAINQSAETISIKASKIKLEGLVTANEGFSIDQHGNMTAKNGSFTGSITGSAITGSSLNIIESSGVKMSFDTNGIEVDARNYKNIFGNYGGRTRMWTSDSLSSTASSIKYTTSSGVDWWAAFCTGFNEMQFIWDATGKTYVEIQSINGAWGITCWASDAKWKKNIEDSTVDGIAAIKKIKHRSFNWKNNDAYVDCGYIAQEMKAINPNFAMALQSKDANGKLMGESNYQVDERYLIPVITKALQEVIEKVETLERKVS